MGKRSYSERANYPKNLKDDNRKDMAQAVENVFMPNRNTAPAVSSESVPGSGVVFLPQGGARQNAAVRVNSCPEARSGWKSAPSCRIIAYSCELIGSATPGRGIVPAISSARIVARATFSPFLRSESALHHRFF
jgi:hypothetical protein